MVARLVGTRLGASLGQPVVVENVAGGSGVIGMRKAARAVPDGYTLVMSTAGAGVIVSATHAPVPYDLEKDFEPITMRAPSSSSCTPGETRADHVAEYVTRALQLTMAGPRGPVNLCLPVDVLNATQPGEARIAASRQLRQPPTARPSCASRTAAST